MPIACGATLGFLVPAFVLLRFRKGISMQFALLLSVVSAVVLCETLSLGPNTLRLLFFYFLFWGEAVQSTDPDDGLPYHKEYLKQAQQRTEKERRQTRRRRVLAFSRYSGAGSVRMTRRDHRYWLGDVFRLSRPRADAGTLLVGEISGRPVAVGALIR